MSEVAAKPYTLSGGTGDWEIVVGLEVHAQISSQSKLFSGASATFGAEPNANVSLVDAAMPGMLPVINGECVRQAVRSGMAMGAKINAWSRFDRKNYFYADLPQGYQISQYQYPVVGEGEVLLDLGENRTKIIGVERIHMEQDAGKSLHDQHPSLSYVDLNRSGVALMEIVSKPDIRSPEEAGAYVKKIRTLLRYVGSCDGNMEEGSMRADVNVSVRKAGADYGTRCEIKNVNSVRYVMQAIEVEARRQIDVIEDGGVIKQETRTFDPVKMETRALRSKEDAHDYRYFPDPDLLPLVLDDEFLAACKASLPELPDTKKARFVESLNITPYTASVLIAEKETADYFEALLADTAKRQNKPLSDVARAASNWVTSDLFGALNKLGKDISSSPISPAQGSELLALIGDTTISGKIAKDVFEIMLETGKSAGTIVEERGLRQVSDSGEIEAIIAKIVANNPDNAAAYRGGKDKLFGFFVGQVMKETGGKANPAMVNELLKKALS
jgi:aspartyl-tRNA(Asn)/glutamyl-tRNA(Gln) amidotransferase subunit B